jgi:ankyrin repeat protein
LKILKGIGQLLFQAKNIDVNQQNKGGSTALIVACAEGHKEIVEMLLQDKNIDINRQDKDGKTALTKANARGNAEINQLLLQHINKSSRGCSNARVE